MKTNTKPNFFATAIIFILTISFICVGSFAISAEHHKKAQIARDIKSKQAVVKKLKIYNEELSARIAEKENPVLLSNRVSSTMSLPIFGKNSAWAYANFKGGRVSYVNGSDRVLTYEKDEKNNSKNKN